MFPMSFFEFFATVLLPIMLLAVSVAIVIEMLRKDQAMPRIIALVADSHLAIRDMVLRGIECPNKLDKALSLIKKDLNRTMRLLTNETEGFGGDVSKLVRGILDQSRNMIIEILEVDPGNNLAFAMAKTNRPAYA